MPVGLEQEIIIWQVIDNNLATLKELETEWSFLDLFKAVSYLNLKADLEEEDRQNDIARAADNSRL